MYQPMFVPPGDNRLLQGAVATFIPGIAQAVANIRDLRIDPEDAARLDALQPTRAILTPNHPTGNDPIVILWLSRMLHQPFNYLCAREVLVGPKGWLLNQLGTY